jgi:hypothetical protein
MPSDKDAAYARFLDEFKPLLDGCVLDTQLRLGVRSNGISRGDCCDPKRPYPPITHDWVYGLPPQESSLRVVLDYIEPDWIPDVTVSTQPPGSIFQQVYSGCDVAASMDSIRTAIEQLSNKT